MRVKLAKWLFLQVVASSCLANDSGNNKGVVGSTLHEISERIAVGSTEGPGANLRQHVVTTAASSDTTQLDLNKRTTFNLNRGESKLFSYSNDGSSGVYLVASVCSQPSSKGTVPVVDYETDLALLIKAYDSSSTYVSEELYQGSIAKNVKSSRAINVEIRAPTYTTSKWSGSWTVQISATSEAVSTVSTAVDLNFMDSDATSALFVTTNISSRWSDSDLPYSLYIYPDSDSSIQSLSGSYCAIASGNYVVSDKTSTSDSKLTNEMLGNQTRELMFVTGLSPSTSYQAFLALPDRSEKDLNVGLVYPSVKFNSKSETNTCQLIYDLPFCSEVGYAVPTDGSLSRAKLKEWYDSKASALYDGFNKTMQQVPCDVNEDIRYSVMRTCQDCRKSYKRWLCLTTIPRCVDSTVETKFQMIDDFETAASVHRMSNNSRNSWISRELNPDPYTELMPCSYTCHKVMQDCPSNIQFQCPLKGKGLLKAYGELNLTTYRSGDLFNIETATCNFFGPVDAINSASVKKGGMASAAIVASMLAVWFLL